jgi:hypothetical protein
VLTLLLAFTGYLLPWDQLALWAVTVGTNMMGYMPVFGSQVRFELLGGFEIGPATLLRWIRATRARPSVRDSCLHGHSLLAGTQGRRHLGSAVFWLMAHRRRSRPIARLVEEFDDLGRLARGLATSVARVVLAIPPSSGDEDRDEHGHDRHRDPDSRSVCPSAVATTLCQEHASGLTHRA